jgi:hypothetical protein
MIVAAAIRSGKLVCSMPAPARHHDVMYAMADAGLPITREAAEQGFLTATGQFATRREALGIAENAGQHLARYDDGYTGYQGPELFSEDLW